MKRNKLINTRWHGKNRSTSAYGNALGFTGRHLDSETGLYYFRARYYDTEQGRFISRDPAGYVDGLGLYNGYFATRFMMDPSGLANCPNVEFGEYGTPSPGILIGQGSFSTSGLNSENLVICNYAQERSRSRTCCSEEFGTLVDVETQTRTGSSDTLLPAGSTCPTRPQGSVTYRGWED